MQLSKRALLISLIIVCASFIDPNSARAEVTSRIISITPTDGVIEITELGGKRDGAIIGGEIEIDSSIATGSNTKASFEISDPNGLSAFLYVREMSTLMIDRIINVEMGLDKIQIHLNSGGFRLLEDSSPSNTVEIEVITPTGIVIPDNADFSVWIDFVTLSTGIEVYHGVVTTRGGQGGSKTLTAGMRNSISEFGRVTEVENFIVIGESVLGESSIEQRGSVINSSLLFAGFVILLVMISGFIWKPNVRSLLSKNR